MVNPNLFAYFITAGMVALIVGWQLEKGWLKWTYFIVALLVASVTWFTGSRLCMAACLVLLAWMCVRSRVLTMIAAIGVCVGAIFVIAAGMIPQLIDAYNTFIVNLNSNSGQTRLHLYQNAGWLFVNTKGVGIGPGRYTVEVTAAPWRTYGAIDPHNGFTEVFVGYGLLVGVILVALAHRDDPAAGGGREPAPLPGAGHGQQFVPQGPGGLVPDGHHCAVVPVPAQDQPLSTQICEVPCRRPAASPSTPSSGSSHLCRPEVSSTSEGQCPVACSAS